ncbi:hypothetical protein D3C80_1625470 [compost metagenome]
MVGEHTASAYVDFDLAVFRLGRVEAELAIQVLEGTGDEAVAQVADLEINEGVLAFLVDYIVRGHHLTCRQYCSTNCQSGESLFQHAFYSLESRLNFRLCDPAFGSASHHDRKSGASMQPVHGGRKK